MGRQESEKFKLFVGEVKRCAVHFRRIARLVDDHAGCVNLAARVRLRLILLAESHANTRIGLCGPGILENDIVDSPVGVDCSEPALGEDNDERNCDARCRQNLAQRLSAREICTRIDKDEVASGRVDERSRLCRDLPRLVAEKPKCGKDINVTRRGQDQKLRHGSSKVPTDSVIAP